MYLLFVLKEKRQKYERVYFYVPTIQLFLLWFCFSPGGKKYIFTIGINIYCVRSYETFFKPALRKRVFSRFSSSWTYLSTHVWLNHFILCFILQIFITLTTVPNFKAVERFYKFGRPLWVDNVSTIEENLFLRDPATLVLTLLYKITLEKSFN